jgi:hypothetical protein
LLSNLDMSKGIFILSKNRHQLVTYQNHYAGLNNGQILNRPLSQPNDSLGYLFNRQYIRVKSTNELVSVLTNCHTFVYSCF